MTAALRTILDIDDRLSHRIRLQPTDGFWWRLNSWLAHSGDSWYWIAALFPIWVFSKGDWHNRAALLSGAIVLQALLVFAFKFIIRRRRPEGEWGAVYRSTDPHSFPSGHATRAGLLVILSWGLGPPWFSLAVLIWAPLMSLSRVTMGLHYLSDIVAGFIFGLVVGKLILDLTPLIMAVFPFGFI
ncbi:MAG: phosphatase PAP2 family protein [Anaerolineaceae bacterium]|nr:phosphatase PAP2 family protein [Anaerolineaceae bacterium]